MMRSSILQTLPLMYAIKLWQTGMLDASGAFYKDEVWLAVGVTHDYHRANARNSG
jgi:hypothetical protein